MIPQKSLTTTCSKTSTKYDSQLEERQQYYCKLQQQVDEEIAIKRLHRLIFNLYRRVSEGIKRQKYDRRQIRLNYLQIGHEAIEQIVECEAKNIEYLQLAYCKLTFRSVQTIIRANWSNLVNLNLKQNRIGVQGMKFLVTKAKWPQLCMLNLQSCKIGNEGVKILFKSSFNTLQRIHLGNNNITDSGIIFLFKFSNFFNLKCITFEKNRITKNIIQEKEHSVPSNCAFSIINYIQLRQLYFLSQFLQIFKKQKIVMFKKYSKNICKIIFRHLMMKIVASKIAKLFSCKQVRNFIQQLVVFYLNKTKKRQHRAMCSRIKWTNEEQEILRFLKEQRKMASWKEIAEQINRQFCKQDKTGKQCRERYINYVRFGVDNSISVEWSQGDDKNFTRLYLLNGPKWCLIAQQMHSKSENLLKNRFYGGLRRIIKKITKVQKGYRVRKTKPIRYETLIRLLDYQCSVEIANIVDPTGQKSFECFVFKLKTNILEATWNLLNGDESEDRIINLIQEIHFFNTEIKNSYSKKRAIDQKMEIQTKLVGALDNSSSSIQAENSIAQGIVQEKPRKSFDTNQFFRQGEKLVGHQNKQDKFQLPQYNLDLSKWREKPISYDLEIELSRILRKDQSFQGFDFALY